MKTVSTVLLSLSGFLAMASAQASNNDFTPPPPPVQFTPHNVQPPTMTYQPAPSKPQVQVYVNPTSNQVPGSNGGGVVLTVPLPGGDPPKPGK